MKKTFSRSLILLTSIILAFSLSIASGCKKEPLVIKESDTYVVISVTEKSLNGKTDLTLKDYMLQIDKSEKDLVFTVENGMITSLNGISNKADFSACWMLYTSDAELSNEGWGSIEYEGKIYGSAMLGAELLTVKAGCDYIWVYTNF